MDSVTGKLRDVSGFKTIASCRDVLINSRDQSATDPLASTKRGNRRQDASSSRTSRGRHGEVGIVEFELYCAGVSTWDGTSSAEVLW